MSVIVLWKSLLLEVVILENIKTTERKNNCFIWKIAAENPVIIPPIKINSESRVALVAKNQVKIINQTHFWHT